MSMLSEAKGGADRGENITKKTKMKREMMRGVKQKRED